MLQERFLPSSVKSIAVFRALQLGDMMCAVPAVRAIKQHMPGASITLVGLPGQRNFAKRFSHYFSGFIEFPGWPGLPERECSPAVVVDFLRDMQERRFDLVIQMQGNGYIVNPMCMLWGGKHTAGLRREQDYCPDERFFPVMEEREHEVLRFLKIAVALGADSSNSSLEFPVSVCEQVEAAAMREKMGMRTGNYICIHGGARDPRRRWQPGNFARVADALAEKGNDILLTGSIDESTVLNEIAANMRHPSLNLVERFGQVDIGPLAALIGQSKGLVSNDTGVSHVATALGVRSIIIFSKYSDPQRWRPLNSALHHAILPDMNSDIEHVVMTTLRHLHRDGYPEWLAERHISPR